MFGGKRESAQNNPVRVQNSAPPQAVRPASNANTSANTGTSATNASPQPTTQPTQNGTTNMNKQTPSTPDASRIVSGERPPQQGFAPRTDSTNGNNSNNNTARDTRDPSRRDGKQNNANSNTPVLSSRENRTLTVGRSIKLRGEIAACDHLIVEGEVDAETAAATKLEISRDGILRGNAKVESASVSGSFDGEIEVKGLLFVEAGGKISGKITCGELEVRRGGRVEGALTYSGKSDTKA